MTITRMIDDMTLRDDPGRDISYLDFIRSINNVIISFISKRISLATKWDKCWFA